MKYKDFTLGDWIGHIRGVIEDETTLDGNEMRDLVEFLSTLRQDLEYLEYLDRYFDESEKRCILNNCPYQERSDKK